MAAVRRRLMTAVVMAGVAATAVAFASPAAAAEGPPPQLTTVGSGPQQSGFVGAFTHSGLFPNSAPPGANDYNCKPSAAHPRPVILVHGTFENAYDNFAYISPELKKQGYCVFALNYGAMMNSLLGFFPSLKGTGDIPDSARELQVYTDYVLSRTGAAKVDMVGHSQGGMLIRQYLKFNGGANAADPSKNKVANAVSIAGSNHGTTLIGIGTLGNEVTKLGLMIFPGVVQPLIGPAGVQQVVGSAVLTNLNAGGDTMPGINYTVIGTRYDEVVTPYTSTFLKAGPGATVRNLTLQDGFCDIDLSDHLSITYSQRTLSYIKQGINPGGGDKTVCSFNAPLSGSGA